MGWLLNLLYLTALLFASPLLLWRRWRKGKRLGGLWSKLTGSQQVNDEECPRIWLHAVSVGEVLLLKSIIHQLQIQFPTWECILSVTTTTGREVAQKTYPHLKTIWYPFDFTWAVQRALCHIHPQLIILSELELWPNFLAGAQRMNIPIVVINGRISQKSYQGYRYLKWLTKSMLQKVDHFAVQNAEYADRLIQLGMPKDRISVTGSLKFDGVLADRQSPKVQHLRHLLGINKDDLVWVVGSTQAPEEAWALEIFAEAKKHHPHLRLLLVPRHQERFEEVAQLFRASGHAFLRRSQLPSPANPPTFQDLILIDTLGELTHIWGLADLAFVGGSFGNRGGQNMIEPAAYGAAAMFGPNTWNFKQIVLYLLRENAAIEVSTKDQWREQTLRLLADQSARNDLGRLAKSLVKSQQGATERTLHVLHTYLIANSISTSVRAA